MKRSYGMTCKNPSCANYKKPLEGKTCPKCKHSLSSAEVTEEQSQVAFDPPYVTKYQAPCLRVEINEPLQKALQVQANQYKQEVTNSTNGEIPEQYQALWTSSADFIALHSIQHQIVKAVPMVVLSSSLDVDAIVTTQKQTKTIGYFYDTCDGGNGAAEAIFSDLPKFAKAAIALATECNCEAGCPCKISRQSRTSSFEAARMRVNDSSAFCLWLMPSMSDLFGSKMSCFVLI